MTKSLIDGEEVGMIARGEHQSFEVAPAAHGILLQAAPSKRPGPKG
jgi:hypothetical protein